MGPGDLPEMLGQLSMPDAHESVLCNVVVTSASVGSHGASPAHVSDLTNNKIWFVDRFSGKIAGATSWMGEMAAWGGSSPPQA